MTDEELQRLDYAIENFMIVQFHYVKANGERGIRTGEPYEMKEVNAIPSLYLWDTDRDAIRQFHMSRMSNLEVFEEQTFVPRF